MIIPKAIISSTKPSPFHLISPNPHQLSATKSTIGSLPFNHVDTTRRFSIKTPSGYRRLRQISAAAATTDYTAAPETETFYELLGIPENGTLSEIKKAYKLMALKYHPDVSPPDRAEEYTRKFIRVQEAYETLSDPETRALYDMDMANGIHLAFSGRKEVRFDGKSWWKDRWESQILELKRRGEFRGKKSWAARIRTRQERSV